MPTSVLRHGVAYNPRLFARAVGSAVVMFLSIDTEAADSPCGNSSQFFCGLASGGKAPSQKLPPSWPQRPGR